MAAPGLTHRNGAIVRSQGLVVGAAALNGVGAALLWTAQGQLLMGYPTAQQKGTYFAIFWVLFNVGTCWPRADRVLTTC